MMVRDEQCLLPPNATSVELALEALTRRVDAIPVPLRAIRLATECPADILPWLAFERAVGSWNPNWSLAIKRNVVAQAISVARKKGTADSVRQVVQAFGGQIALREWFQQDPPGDPHTFQLILTLNGEGGEPASAAFVDEVIAAVERTKPARSRFTFTQGLTAEGGLGLAGGARPAAYRRLQLEEVA
ncbi:MAG: phage tail protein I [Brevundimonas sp.]|uniref:phage tail protein I n=1 Tax=Brevundimonas sp. TaxID=1871086 RepID=UPI002724440E|nr:phage tail protein I [Brevundimonas sp.]MDO9607218.1 phage tail protein I [Brevundimonas sp.]